MPPKFTIITVVLNSKKYLEQTIKSICSQNFQDFELIVIDGGSTDGTQDIINIYSHIITKFISEKDDGLYHAMNKGIKIASGEGLIFLNAGDLLCKQVLSANIKIPSLISVSYINYFNKKKKLKPKFYKLGIPYCHQGIVFENKKIFFNTDLKIASDYDFYLKHNYNNQLKFSKTDGYIFYDNNGLSSINHKLRDKEINKIIKKNFGIFWSNLFLIISFFKRIIRIILKK